MTDKPIDPVTLEVIKNALTSVADELALINAAKYYGIKFIERN